MHSLVPVLVRSSIGDGICRFQWPTPTMESLIKVRLMLELMLMSRVMEVFGLFEVRPIQVSVFLIPLVALPSLLLKTP